MVFRCARFARGSSAIMGRKNSSVKLINVCKCINAVFGKVGVDANMAHLKRRISHVPNLMRSAENLLFSLICIRFGTCELRCLDRAFVTPFVKMCIKNFFFLIFGRNTTFSRCGTWRKGSLTIINSLLPVMEDFTSFLFVCLFFEDDHGNPYTSLTTITKF